MGDPIAVLRRLAEAVPNDASVSLSAAFLRDLVSALPREAGPSDLSLREAARELGISADTTRRLIRAQQLTAYRGGGRQWRVRPEAVEAYRRSGTLPQAPATVRKANPDLGSWRRSRPTS